MRIGFTILISGALIYGGVRGLLWLDNYRCVERWAQSGFKAKMSYGCAVEIEPGKWVPETSVQIRPR